MKTLIIIVCSVCLIGCATSRNVSSSRTLSAPLRSLKTVYVVNNGGKSNIGENIQDTLVHYGFNVRSGPDVSTLKDTDLIVRYTDRWRWDLVMYLRSLDVRVYDGATGDLLVSGSWKNSPLHGFYSAETVVTTLLNDTFNSSSSSARGQPYQWRPDAHPEPPAN